MTTVWDEAEHYMALFSDGRKLRRKTRKYRTRGGIERVRVSLFDEDGLEVWACDGPDAHNAVKKGVERDD